MATTTIGVFLYFTILVLFGALSYYNDKRKSRP